jgi:DNA-binding transcriptional regulator YdaS (Cro superfamily)
MSGPGSLALNAQKGLRCLCDERTMPGMEPRTALKASGLSLTDVAEKLTVAPCTASRWFAGKLAVPLDKAVEIERLTGGRVTVAALAALSPPTKPRRRAA